MQCFVPVDVVLLLMACGGCGFAKHQLPSLWRLKGTTLNFVASQITQT